MTEPEAHEQREREQFIAMIAAAMMSEVTASEVLRYAMFPGMDSKHSKHGWLEVYAALAQLARNTADAVIGWHHTFDAFWHAVATGPYNVGVLYYDLADELLALAAEHPEWDHSEEKMQLIADTALLRLRTDSTEAKAKTLVDDISGILLSEPKP